MWFYPEELNKTRDCVWAKFLPPSFLCLQVSDNALSYTYAWYMILYPPCKLQPYCFRGVESQRTIKPLMVGRLCCRKLDIFFTTMSFCGIAVDHRWEWDAGKMNFWFYMTWLLILCIENMIFGLHFPGHRRVCRKNISLGMNPLFTKNCLSSFEIKGGRMWGTYFLNRGVGSFRTLIPWLYHLFLSPSDAPAALTHPAFLLHTLCDVCCTWSWDEPRAGHSHVRGGTKGGHGAMSHDALSFSFCIFQILYSLTA